MADKKALEQLVFPEDIRYYREHTWARTVDGVVRIGISDHAQNELGDLIFVELPQVGDVLKQGQEFGCAESAKTVSTLYMPVGGEVIAVNDEMADAPDLVNQDPYGRGWMIEVRPAETEPSGLMNSQEYVKSIAG